MNFLLYKYDSLLEVELAIEKFKKTVNPRVHQISFRLIQAGGGILHREIHKVIVLIWNNK